MRACTICGDPVGDCWHDTAATGRTRADDYFGQSPRWLRRSGLSAGAKVVFDELSEHYMTHKGAPFVGTTNLADNLNTYPGTVKKWTDELAAAGIIDIYEEGHSGTHYRIIHWPSRGIVNPVVNLPPARQRKRRTDRTADYYTRKFGTAVGKSDGSSETVPGGDGEEPPREPDPVDSATAVGKSDGGGCRQIRRHGCPQIRRQ